MTSTDLAERVAALLDEAAFGTGRAELAGPGPVRQSWADFSAQHFAIARRVLAEHADEIDAELLPTLEADVAAAEARWRRRCAGALRYRCGVQRDHRR